MSPRECPRCGGANIRTRDDGAGRARVKGRAVCRIKVCTDCGFEGMTVELWTHGPDWLVGILSDILGVE